MAMPIIFICITILGMGFLYFILESRKHTRRERIVENIGVLEDELEDALIKFPNDIALHGVLRGHIKRLREELNNL